MKTKKQNLFVNKSSDVYAFVKPRLSIDDYPLFSSEKYKLFYSVEKNNKPFLDIMFKKAFDDDFFDLYINGDWVDFSDYDCFSFFQSQKTYNEHNIKDALFCEVLFVLNRKKNNNDELKIFLSKEIADTLYKDFTKMEEICKKYCV